MWFTVEAIEGSGVDRFRGSLRSERNRPLLSPECTEVAGDDDRYGSAFIGSGEIMETGVLGG